MLAEALTAMDESGRRSYEAEIYRFQGEFLLHQAVLDTAQPKLPSSTPSRWPAASKPNPGSCGRR